MNYKSKGQNLILIWDTKLLQKIFHSLFAFNLFLSCFSVYVSLSLSLYIYFFPLSHPFISLSLQSLFRQQCSSFFVSYILSFSFFSFPLSYFIHNFMETLNSLFERPWPKVLIQQDDNYTSIVANHLTKIICKIIVFTAFFIHFDSIQG